MFFYSIITQIYFFINFFVGDVIDNWTTVPISNMTLVNYDESCPDGFTSFYSDAFTGSAKGSCACTSNTLGYESSYANCTDTIEATTQCVSDPAIKDGFNLKLWRGKTLCYQRAGQAACEFDVKKQESYTGSAASTPWRRPRPDKDGSCPTGYQRCGAFDTTTYSESKAICFPDEFACPLTGLKVVSTSTLTSAQNAGYTEYLGTFDDSYLLYGRRDGVSDVLPSIFLEAALAELSGGTSYDMLQYEASDNPRGICYNNQGSDQVIPGSFTYDNDDATADQENDVWDYSFNTKCSRIDTRWDIVDNNNIESHYIRNFQYLVDDCEDNRAGDVFYALGDSNFNANVNDDPDIYQGGTNTRSYEKVYEDYFTVTAAPTCTAGDDICTNVYYQTVCGKYIHLAHQFERAWEDVTYGVYNQNEIYWSESCESEQVIYDNYGALLSVTAAQLAVVVTNTLFGVIGIALMYQMVINQRKKNKVPFTSTVTKTSVEPNQWIDYLITIFKLAPILASLIITGASYRVWLSVGSSKECSDSTTNYTFSFLADALPKIYDNTIVTFVLDIILLVFGTFAILKERQQERYEARNASYDENSKLYCLVELPKPSSWSCNKEQQKLEINCFENTYSFDIPSGCTVGQTVRLYADGEIYSQ